MGLNINPVLTFTPPSVPKAGGTTIATFERRSTGADTFEKTTYTIAAEVPYVFANASEPGNRKVVRSGTQRVTVDPDNRRQTLVLKRTKSPATITMVPID